MCNSLERAHAFACWSKRGAGLNASKFPAVVCHLPLLKNTLFKKIEDQKLIRIVLTKTNRDAGNCWSSLLENEYAADPWVQDQMQRKLTLERFQREASPGTSVNVCGYVFEPRFVHYESRVLRRILNIAAVVYKLWSHGPYSQCP